MILLTFDIEDWFQVENLRPCFPERVWDRCELRVEESTRRVLDLLDEASGERAGNGEGGPVRATFFVLGWVAERVPRLVREICARGHEVASHGYGHRLCRLEAETELVRDLERSRKLLEDLTGRAVVGYRAPGFSITPEVLQLIAASGYRYDSSYNSFTLNPRYGRLDLNGSRRRGIAHEVAPGFHELPLGNLEIGGRVLPWAGGGYFRLLPPKLFTLGVKRILAGGRDYLFYLHPWEFDPGQPRVERNGRIGRLSRFRHYVNLERTGERLRRLIQSFPGERFVACGDYLEGVGA